MEEGRKEGRDGWMDGWREGGREGVREGGMDGWMDGGMQTGAHYRERTTPILTLCHGVFTDQSIFRYAWEYFFQRKF